MSAIATTFTTDSSASATKRPSVRSPARRMPKTHAKPARKVQYAIDTTGPSSTPASTSTDSVSARICWARYGRLERTSAPHDEEARRAAPVAKGEEVGERAEALSPEERVERDAQGGEEERGEGRSEVDRQVDEPVPLGEAEAARSRSTRRRRRPAKARGRPALARCCRAPADVRRATRSPRARRDRRSPARRAACARPASGPAADQDGARNDDGPDHEEGPEGHG